MQIIILGAGQVGASLAETLSREGHGLTVIDRNYRKLQRLERTLEIKIIEGNAAYPEVLTKAGAEKADMIIAVTNNDELNIVACLVCTSLFHTPIKIARLRSSHYADNTALFANELDPINVIISPERIVSTDIYQLISYPGALQVISLTDNIGKMMAVRITYDSDIINNSIKDIKIKLDPHHATIVGIFRNKVWVDITDEVILQVNDEVLFIAPSKKIKNTMNLFISKAKSAKYIVIYGGSNIAILLAKLLTPHYQVKIIESDYNRCRYLSQHLNNVLVLNGDMSDNELIDNENIDACDMFCALTEDDEENIIACMQAKRKGVQHVLAIINRTAYVDLLQTSQINSIISPQYATVGSILTYVRQGDVVAVHALQHTDAEILEIIVHGDNKTSKVIGKSWSQINIPQGVMIAGVIRGKQMIWPYMSEIIEADDIAVLFLYDKSKIAQLEKIFSVSVRYF